jgi:RNA polymerase sigma-70 factor (ECF subfamily)
MPDPEADPAPRAAFPTTRWSQVVAAGDPAEPSARLALEELCRAYWYPLYAFIRRKGHDAEQAADLTQDYFARLLGSGLLARADRSKGRFRAFLRTDCSFFLSHQAEAGRARKRGGGASPLSIDARDAEGRYLREPADPGLTPDCLFDRAWALGLLDSVLARLAREHAEAGQLERFEALRPTLEGGRSTPHAEIAARLDTTEAAVEAAARRLRRRYREALREQIAATLEDPTDDSIDAEIRDLFAALGD